MELPTVFIFEEWKGGIGVTLIDESDLAIVQKESNVVATVKLNPGDHRGDMLLAALVAETLGTPHKCESFSGALENLLQEAFLAGVRSSRSRRRRGLPSAGGVQQARYQSEGFFISTR